MKIQDYLPHRHIPIITYHQIGTIPRHQDPAGMSISLERFASQMQYLKQQGYQTLSLDALMQTKVSSKKQIVISFDDGFADNYYHALPILQQHGFCATVFLVSDCIGKQSNWGKYQYPMLTWSQIQEMQQYNIHFQSHTVNHINLANCDKKTALLELIQSKQHIEDKIGTAVQHIAYPYGSYHDDTPALVAKAGYLRAYGSSMTREQPFEISRFNLYGSDKIATFKIQASHWGHCLRYWRWQLG